MRSAKHSELFCQNCGAKLDAQETAGYGPAPTYGSSSAGGPAQPVQGQPQPGPQPDPQPGAQSRQPRQPEMQNGSAAAQQTAAKTNGENEAIISLVLGVSSILLSLFLGFLLGWFSIILAIIGIVLGVMARRDPAHSAMGTAGMICAIIGIVIGVLEMIACVAIIGMAADILKHGLN